MEFTRFVLVALLCVGSLAREGSSLGAAELRGAGLRHAALGVDARHLHHGGEALNWTDQAGILQQPIPYKKQSQQWLPDFKGKKLSSCFIIAIAGSLLAFVGLAFLWFGLTILKATDLLMGDKARRTNAKLTGKRYYTTTSDDHVTHHYVASYTFEGVRDDGMRCCVTVNDRELNQFSTPSGILAVQTFFAELEVGQDTPVFYAVENPGRCRLMQAAMADHANARGCEFCLNQFAAVLFLGAGILIGAGLSAFCGLQTSGIMGALLCIGLFLICTGSCFAVSKPLVEKFALPSAANVKELGLQERAAHLGDLSGLWLLESEFGSFEYNFEPFSATVVMVKGRPAGRKDWDPEFEAHFAGEEGNEMIWDDDENAHFRLLFDSSELFTGSRCTDAGDKVTFKGSRVSAAAESISQ